MERFRSRTGTICGVSWAVSTSPCGIRTPRKQDASRSVKQQRETLDLFPPYARGLNPDTALETVARCRDAGFRAFKVKVAFGADTDTRVVSSPYQEIFGQVSVLWWMQTKVGIWPKLVAW